MVGKCGKARTKNNKASDGTHGLWSIWVENAPRSTDTQWGFKKLISFFFCFVPCLEARNQRITKHKPLMVFQGQKQQLGLHSWKLLIIASLGYKTSFNHRKFLAKREKKQNKTKQCSKFKHTQRKSYLGDHQVVKQYDIEKTEALLSNTDTKTAPSCFSTPTTPISP